MEIYAILHYVLDFKYSAQSSFTVDFVVNYTDQ